MMIPDWPIFHWHTLSKSMNDSIENPLYMGVFNQDHRENMRYVEGSDGAVSMGIQISIMLLVDEEDGVIVDAKYQAFGETICTAVLEELVPLLLRKNYDQALRIQADMVEKRMLDKSKLPHTIVNLINVALSALAEALEKCTDIPLPVAYTPPSPFEEVIQDGHMIENFLSLDDQSKRQALMGVIEKDIQPYIALDEGGVSIKEINGYEVMVSYSGSCTSCYSSVGATLETIGKILRAKVHPHLTVIADMDSLTLG